MAQTGRNAQGVRLIRLGNEELLVGVVSIEAVEEDETFEEVDAIETEQLVDDSTIMDQTENKSDLNEPEED